MFTICIGFAILMTMVSIPIWKYSTKSISFRLNQPIAVLQRQMSFFESIGSPKFISAPMVDQSSLPWRLFVRKHGADLAFSQMMHGKNFINDRKYRRDCIDWDDYQHVHGNATAEQEAKLLDQPLIAQFAGDNPSVLVEAGRFIHHDVAAIDLNLGCPQKIAKKGNYGSYLLPNVALVSDILQTLVTKLDCPVTAKVRVLPDVEETLRLCKIIEDCGVSMLTVHGRTVAQSKLFTGSANWDIIRLIKDSMSIPVVANGGVGCRNDALECLEYTGADAVMSSEALLENPKLFSEEGDYLFRHDFVRAQLATVKEFLELVNSYPLPRPINQVIRGHLFKMLHRFVNAPLQKDVQRQLATGDFMQMQTVVFILEERLRSVGFDTARAEEQGLITRTGYYMRHRDERAQSRVLSLPKHQRWQRKDVSVGSGFSGGTASSVTSLDTHSDRLEAHPSQKQAELKQRLLLKHGGSRLISTTSPAALQQNLSQQANHINS